MIGSPMTVLPDGTMVCASGHEGRVHFDEEGNRIDLGSAAEDLAAMIWRPIETAPKDGTDFLAAIPAPVTDEKWWFMVASWDDEWSKFTSFPDWQEIEPTYWTPLPAPPSED